MLKIFFKPYVYVLQVWAFAVKAYGIPTDNYKIFVDAEESKSPFSGFLEKNKRYSIRFIKWIKWSWNRMYERNRAYIVCVYFLVYL